jgi:hypothetical protein
VTRFWACSASFCTLHYYYVFFYVNVIVILPYPDHVPLLC